MRDYNIPIIKVKFKKMAERRAQPSYSHKNSDITTVH
jgi:hypothetical protein